MTGQLSRLLEILLPRGGGVMFLIEGYFDESGALDEPPGIFSVSGYFIAADAAKLMDEEWGKVLETHKIPYFHMVDCAHGVQAFKDMDCDERVEVVKKLIELIKRHTLEGFSIFANAEAYRPSNDAPDAYSECASACVSALQMFLKMNRLEGEIAYFFELGHKSKGTAYNHIAQKIKRPTDSLTFAAKEKVRLLQAADLLAWQSTKYAKDWLYPTRRGEPPKRQPRKDFQSLMEHSHSFMHMDVKDGAKYMGIELWPLSKRSRYSVDASINDDGPIVFLRETGDDTPIIPVDKTMGYRMGGARLTYVAFEGMGERKFALAFDEPRLFEAIARLLQATKLHEQSKIAPLFSAESAFIERADDRTVLRVKLREGASLAFDLSPEVTKGLIEQLTRK